MSSATLIDWIRVIGNIPLLDSGLEIKSIVINLEYEHFFDAGANYKFYESPSNRLEYPANIKQSVYSLYRLLFLPPVEVYQYAAFNKKYKEHHIYNWRRNLKKPALNDFPELLLSAAARADILLNETEAHDWVIDYRTYIPDDVLKDVKKFILNFF